MSTARNSPPPRLSLTLNAQTARRHVPFLRRRLLAAHALLRPALSELSLAIVGAARMAALHRQFLGRSGPTDVLSFELDYDSTGRVTCGEVVICATIARRSALQHHQPLAHELLLYALHGMLHLCSFDDTTHATFQAMHAKEDEILTRLGVGPVFRPPPLTGRAAGDGRRRYKARGKRPPPPAAQRRAISGVRQCLSI